MLMRWSNDRLKATLHKVEVPSKHQISSDTTVPERYSIAFFCNANKDVQLECLESCCSDEIPAKYPPINAYQYITQRLQDTINTAAPLQEDRKPQWLVEVDMEEIKSTPQQRVNNNEHGTSTTRFSSMCRVCQQLEAKYTCPRCQLPYCSVDCYRNHNNNHNNNNSNENTGLDTSCAEKFYKSKVNAILALERLENQQGHQEILNRLYQKENIKGSADDVEDVVGDIMAEEDLYQLWSNLEELGEDATQTEIDKIIPPLLRNKFQRDLQQGKAQHLVLKDWFPWWKNHLVVKSDEETNQDNSRDQTVRPKKTLDDRLLETPPFESLSNGRPPSPVLLFNVVNVLYSACFTLRLYYGVTNASLNAPTEAAATLISNSAVLSRDARFLSLTEVLVYCSQGVKHDSTTISAPWDVLVGDVAMLVESHRLVGRTLLESVDILNAARKDIKRKNEILSTKPINPQNIVFLKQLGVLRKKIQFFLSWSQHREIKTLLKESKLKDGILSWKEEWTIKHGEVDIVSQCS
jgi:hypothetical protein